MTTVGDVGTVLSGTVLDGGAPKDISGASLALTLQPPGQAAFVRTATVTDGPNGRWEYTWAVGDLVVPGDWQVSATVVDGSITQTFGPTRRYINPGLA